MCTRRVDGSEGPPFGVGLVAILVKVDGRPNVFCTLGGQGGTVREPLVAHGQVLPLDGKDGQVVGHALSAVLGIGGAGELMGGGGDGGGIRAPEPSTSSMRRAGDMRFSMR